MRSVRVRSCSLPLLVLAASVPLTGCAAVNERNLAPGAGEQYSGSLVGAGSSAQQAAMQGWTAGFAGVQPEVSVDYDPIGSGGGREQFLAGGTDFAGSDAYLDDEELGKAEQRCGSDGVFELPNYIAPIAVVYNVAGIDELDLSPTTMAGIFDQRITRWDDPAIVEDNPGVQLPDLGITPVNRSDESGTTENFVDYLHQAAGEVWPHEVDGSWPVPGGEAAQGNSGVVGAVRAGNGTIGYADLSQVGDLGVARIRVGDEYVAPSAEAAAAVVENSQPLEGRGPHDYAIEVNRDTAGSGEYPIVLISYHIGCVTYDDPNTAELVRAFLGYVVSEEGQEAAALVAGSAPISDRLRDQALTAIDAVAAG
ncbi:phosphate ABC transporter substrate-binding protein PstS [Blastococcus sp. PRF04-17]|uniref:phosphate ABC transporter substrate-binding protein PstS n=1 Tax=Blastococcus sp. PRF04-17 TaxID=2933797 RepID=UPI001FF2C308|nr:phosphate ABC transporter substrate-binding protein PstS [Blastococcus sp. PRF04-17]UOY00904.1 phosphate ABC transporter substrate-binding protein PstS [Blastococcus sp. PRF04-17]